MSDFTSDFWSLYVAGLALVSILACGVLLFIMGRMRVQASPRKSSADGPGTTGHVWDEDLAEYNNPLPRWWMWMFYITIAYSLGYLVFYPGLGTFRGSSAGRRPEPTPARFASPTSGQARCMRSTWRWT